MDRYIVVGFLILFVAILIYFSIKISIESKRVAVIRCYRSGKVVRRRHRTGETPCGI